jgi:hypothetical protein
VQPFKNTPGCFVADPGSCDQLFDGRSPELAQAAEIAQELKTGLWPDTGDLLQLRAKKPRLALLPVIRNGKTMRFIAQSL